MCAIPVMLLPELTSASATFADVPGETADAVPSCQFPVIKGVTEDDPVGGAVLDEPPQPDRDINARPRTRTRESLIVRSMFGEYTA